MTILLKVLINLLLVIVIGICLAGILLILLISVVYIVGYIYDCFFGNFLLKIGYFMGEKFPGIKEITFFRKCWRRIKPKELYLRYETPLFTYYFSYTAISLLAIVLPNKSRMGIVLASILYLLFYFIGMARKCGSDEQYYEKVLNNNMDFLRLSFLPLGFIITVLGFYFTITGMRAQEISFDFSILQSIYISIMNCNAETNLLILLFKILAVGVSLLVLFYIISLPVQIISYFIISVINYFRKYKRAYIGLFKKYLKIVVYLLKSIR